MWQVEFTDEFGQWWNSPTESEQDAVDRSIGLLENLADELYDNYLAELKKEGLI